MMLGQCGDPHCPNEARVRDLEREVDRLRRENEKLRSETDRLSGRRKPFPHEPQGFYSE